jgi:hypothetical protein
VPSVEKLGPVNQDIINYQRGVLKEEKDRLAFMETYQRLNGGSLNGAADAWSRYVSANPYTVTQGKRVKLNTNRRDWQTHFGLTAPAARSSAPRTNAAASAPRTVKTAHGNVTIRQID